MLFSNNTNPPYHSLVLNERTFDRLDQVRKNNGFDSIEDVVNRAVSLYVHLSEVHGGPSEIHIKYDDELKSIDISGTFGVISKTSSTNIAKVLYFSDYKKKS